MGGFRTPKNFQTEADASEKNKIPLSILPTPITLADGIVFQPLQPKLVEFSACETNQTHSASKSANRETSNET